jgi:hypothetical protein
MTLLAVMLCGCSSVDLPTAVYTPPAPPTASAMREGIKKAAAEEKLTGALEISDIRPTDRGQGHFFVCLREVSQSWGSPSWGTHYTYAVFFDGDNYKRARQSVLSEACETATLVPLD